MCDWIKSSLPVEVYGENGHKHFLMSLFSVTQLE